MKKLLVVDDENIIREGLKTMIDGSVSGLAPVLTANGGEEALAVLERESIDILMADLHMPGMSGMELIRQARALDRRLIIIVLSGYSEFEYAQSAIQYKVLHYLLKPVKRMELFSVLEQAVHELEEIDQVSHQLRTSSQQRIVSLIHSGAKASEIGNLLGQEGDVDLKDSQCVVMLVHHSPRESTRTRVLEALADQFEALRKDDMWLFNGSLDAENIVCVVGSPQLRDNEDMLQRLGRGLCALGRDSEPVTCGISDIHDIQGGEGRPYAQALACLRERLLFGNGRAYMSKTVKSRDNRLILSYMDYFQICAYVDDGKFDALRQWLHDHFDQPVAEKRISARAYIDNLKNIQLEVLTHCNYNGSLSAETAKVEELAETCHDYSESINKFIEILSLSIKIKTKSATDVKSQSIMVAQEYIKKNYNRQLTLDDIAAQVAKNPAYLSASFKRETGMHLMDYINEVRIEMAMKKLKDPKTKIYEVAYDTGFLSDKYFSKVFKKITGFTPKEYRNQQQ